MDIRHNAKCIGSGEDLEYERGGVFRIVKVVIDIIAEEIDIYVINRIFINGTGIHFFRFKFQLYLNRRVFRNRRRGGGKSPSEHDANITAVLTEAVSINFRIFFIIVEIRVFYLVNNN